MVVAQMVEPDFFAPVIVALWNSVAAPALGAAAEPVARFIPILLDSLGAIRILPF